MSRLRTGFIGLGNMGADQVRRLMSADLDLCVHDISASAMDAFRDSVRCVASAAEMAQYADIVGICVRDDQQVRDTLTGSDGLLDALQPGAVVLIHSTVRPGTIVELHAMAAERGVALLDAAVSRTRHNGDGPFLAVMLGGDAELLPRLRPVLDAYATDVFLAGPPGSGMAMKIVNNLVTWSHIVTVSQALRLASAGGVDASALLGLMTSNGNLTPTTRAFAAGLLGKQRDLPFMESQAAIGEKDLLLAAEFAIEAGISAPLTWQTRDYLRTAMLGGI